MVLQLILLCALAALVELDDTYVAQLGVSSPLVAGVLFGWLTGDVSSGLQTGAFMTLLLLDYTPVGGVIGPNGAVAVFCTLILVMFGMSIYLAFFAGVVCGILFRTFERFYRTYMGRFMLRREKAMQLVPEKAITAFIAAGLTLQFLLTFIFLLCFTAAAKEIVNILPDELPEKLTLALKLSFFAVPWIGVMMAFKKFTFKAR